MVNELKEKYPTQRYIKEVKIIAEKVKGGYYHIPQRIGSPESSFDTIMGIMNLERETQEIFGVMALDTKEKVIGFDIVHKGSLNVSLIHPRDVYKCLLLRNAAKYICFHNHPSGDPMPSMQDIEITKVLEEVGIIMGIPLLDHIITGDEGTYKSLRGMGYLQ